MTRQSFGSMISALRKEKGMTQLELAQVMGVTDKAVSKWERDLSLPDVGSLPKLAETLGVSVDELLQAKTAAQEKPATRAKAAAMVDLVLKAVALAMGVGAAAIAVLDSEVPVQHLCIMLGLGLACLALTQIARVNGDKF